MKDKAAYLAGGFFLFLLAIILLESITGIHDYYLQPNAKYYWFGFLLGSLGPLLFSLAELLIDMIYYRRLLWRLQRLNQKGKRDDSTR